MNVSGLERAGGCHTRNRISEYFQNCCPAGEPKEMGAVPAILGTKASGNGNGFREWFKKLGEFLFQSQRVANDDDMVDFSFLMFQKIINMPSEFFS